MIKVDIIHEHILPSPHHHLQIQELESDTRYSVCVEARQRGGGVGDKEVIIRGDCYRVRTLPKVDNVAGTGTLFLWIIIYSTKTAKTLMSIDT